MHRNPTYQSALCFVILALVGPWAAACESGKSQTEAESSSEVSPAKGATQEAGSARSALASYESIRASLAKDDIGATTAAAGALEKSARSAAATASADAKAQWTKLANAAKQLQALPKQDADAVRKAFGDVSEPMIALLKSNPELSKGLHVFECPMAEGFQKWVQPSAQMANPYMGSRMLECGSEVKL